MLHHGLLHIDSTGDERESVHVIVICQACYDTAQGLCQNLLAQQAEKTCCNNERILAIAYGDRRKVTG
jgi:hypothetical protein